MGKNGKEIRAKYDNIQQDPDYRRNSLRNYNPDVNSGTYAQYMVSNGVGQNHLLVKTAKGSLRLTNSSVNKRNKRIRPDVIKVMNKHVAKQVNTALDGLKGQQAKSVRRLVNQRNFKKALKALNIPISHGTLTKRVRRPDRYVFAIESKGGVGGRTRQ